MRKQHEELLRGQQKLLAAFGLLPGRTPERGSLPRGSKIGTKSKQKEAAIVMELQSISWIVERSCRGAFARTLKSDPRSLKGSRRNIYGLDRYTYIDLTSNMTGARCFVVDTWVFVKMMVPFWVLHPVLRGPTGEP